MLNKITIFTENCVAESRKENIIDILRATIVNICKNKHYKTFTEDEKRLIDFRPPPPYFILPTILYGQPKPQEKEFEIFGYGDIGKQIICKIADVLRSVKKITLYKPHSNEILRVIKIDTKKEIELKENLPFLPSPLSDNTIYYTATPMLFFDKQKDFNYWFMLKKECEKGNITENAKNRKLKEAIVRSMKNSLKKQLQQRVKDKEYPFVDNINIDIIDFSFAMMRYHKDQPRTPFLRMRFKSNWTLPLFLGHHTGKGYGMILLDKQQRRA